MAPTTGAHQDGAARQGGGVGVRLYFAGSIDLDREFHEIGMRNRLLTFAERETTGQPSFRFWLGDVPGKHVFVDCGAYSVFMRGVKIDIDKYCQFAHDNAGKFQTLVMLDEIGNPEQTEKNMAYMHARGLDPLPVYTAAAPTKTLEGLLERYKHIAIGGMRAKEPGIQAWQRRHLDRVFGVIEKHWPVKTHLFGVVAQWVLERYPLYSCDSTGAVVGAGMGRLLRWEEGKLSSLTWREYLDERWDATVADTIGKEEAHRKLAAAKAEGLVGGGRFNADSAHVSRRCFSVREQLKYERYITDLWTSRGVIWDDHQ